MDNSLNSWFGEVERGKVSTFEQNILEAAKLYECHKEKSFNNMAVNGLVSVFVLVHECYVHLCAAAYLSSQGYVEPAPGQW